jgi:hypothetical protein
MNPWRSVGAHAGFASGAGFRFRKFEEMTMKARSQPGKKDKANGSSTEAPPIRPELAGYPREELVAVAAYYRAQRRGFAPNDEISDWLEAEAEVESLLKTVH